MITTVDGVTNGLGNDSDRLVLDKASIANTVAGGFFSLFRATGIPAQGAIPTVKAICNKALLGAFGFANTISPVKNYLGYFFLTNSNNTTSNELHDRLVHMGGLNMTLLTSQTVGLDLVGVPADRIGDTNYSDVQWWIELYADGGATASNATVNVTYNDDTTGNLSVIAVGGTLRASRMIPLISASNGKFIKSVNSVTLSASTAVAGNFGFTATRIRSTMPLILANKQETFDFLALGFPEIPNDACLFFIQMPTTTTTGALRGGGKIIHG